MADQALPRRSEVPVEETWDLTLLFETIEDYEAALQASHRKAEAYAEAYNGKIAGETSAAVLIRILGEYEALLLEYMKVGTYANLAASVDMTDNALQARYQRFSTIMAGDMAQLSFFDSELKQLPDSMLDTVAAAEPQYASMMLDIKEAKAHSLSPETERVLSALAPAIDFPEELYSITKLGDIEFPDFTVNGKTYPNSYVLFENFYQHETDTDVRRAAFSEFSRAIRKYINTTAATFNAQVQKEKTMATLRGFDSVIDYLLDRQKVPRELYDRQIDVIMSDLAPHMRRYVSLIKQEYGLDKLYYSDLKLPLDPAFTPHITREESMPYVENGLAVMGEDYVNLVMRSYPERWVDWASNIGKSTGGFCASVYGGNSFILLSWNGLMSEVFTLVHELGHAAHFMIAAEHNKPFNYSPSMYVVEAPSTINEQLLGNYLREQSDDPRFQSWVASSMVGNNYYHNFVTHLLEAAYQREVYRRVDDGQNLQADDLSGIFRDVLKQFWGDTVILDEGAELTWMRQPHYYNGLYSYVYSASLTIATAAAQRILTEGQPAVDDWLAALASGATYRPIEWAQIAGVDITTDKPLRDTIAYIGKLIDSIEIQPAATRDFVAEKPGK